MSAATRLALSLTVVFFACAAVAPEARGVVLAVCFVTAVLGGALLRSMTPRATPFVQSRPKRRGRTRFMFGLGIGLHGVWPFVIVTRRPR
jgi:hypothetical protein